MRAAATTCIGMIVATLLLGGCQTKPPGQVQRVTFYSRALHANMRVDVYLPPGYQTSNTPYPVLYLLHGKDGTADSWMTTPLQLNSIHINSDANQLIDIGRLKPMVIVSPEIDNGYGINTGGVRRRVGDYNRGAYETYIADELVRYINQHYHVSPRATDRFIGGYSMGGFAALHIALTHPDEYRSVGVMSAALWNGPLPQSLAWIYPTPKAKLARDPITWANTHHVQTRVEIIEGTSDPFFTADTALYRALRRDGDKHVHFYTYPGGHTYSFWRTHAEQLLMFFGGKHSA